MKRAFNKLLVIFSMFITCSFSIIYSKAKVVGDMSNFNSSTRNFIQTTLKDICENNDTVVAYRNGESYIVFAYEGVSFTYSGTDIMVNVSRRYNNTTYPTPSSEKARTWDINDSSYEMYFCKDNGNIFLNTLYDDMGSYSEYVINIVPIIDGPAANEVSFSSTTFTAQSLPTTISSSIIKPDNVIVTDANNNVINTFNYTVINENDVGLVLHAEYQDLPPEPDNPLDYQNDKRYISPLPIQYKTLIDKYVVNDTQLNRFYYLVYADYHVFTQAATISSIEPNSVYSQVANNDRAFSLNVPYLVIFNQSGSSSWIPLENYNFSYQSSSESQNLLGQYLTATRWNHPDTTTAYFESPKLNSISNTGTFNWSDRTAPRYANFPTVFAISETWGSYKWCQRWDIQSWYYLGNSNYSKSNWTYTDGNLADKFDISNIYLQNVLAYLQNNNLNDLIANGTPETSGKVDAANNDNDRLSDSIDSFESVESGYIDSMGSNLEVISTDSDLFNNSKFLSSASWVSAQFNTLTNNTPFGSVLGFSLILGLSLILIGKFK